MWNRSWFGKETLDDGWSTGQVGQKDAARNRSLRLPKMQETVQSSLKQTKDLGAYHHRPHRERKAYSPSPLYF